MEETQPNVTPINGSFFKTYPSLQESATYPLKMKKEQFNRCPVHKERATQFANKQNNVFRHVHFTRQQRSAGMREEASNQDHTQGTCDSKNS